MSEVEYARAADGTYLAFRLLDADAECDAGNDIIMASGGLISMEVFHDDPAFVRLLVMGHLAGTPRRCSQRRCARRS